MHKTNNRMKTVLVNKQKQQYKQTVLAQGQTKKVFTQENLQITFGGVLRHFILAGETLHKDDDARQVTILSDDERPVVLYGEQDNSELSSQLDNQLTVQETQQKTSASAVAK